MLRSIFDVLATAIARFPSAARTSAEVRKLDSSAIHSPLAVPIVTYSQLLNLLLLVTITPAALGQAPEPIGQFVASHCLGCHGGAEAEANFDLEALASDDVGLENDGARERIAQWVKAFDRVAKGEMPPPDDVQLDEQQRREFLDPLEHHLLRSERERYASDGRTVYRRLNRVEYEHTLQDVLALPHLAIRGKLPPDQTADHFNNQAEALELSYVHMARYLDAAQFALHEAIELGPRPEKRQWTAAAAKLGQLNKGIDINGARGVLRQTNSAQTPFYINPFRPHADGRYHFEIEAFGFHWNKGEVEKSRSEQVVAIYATPNKSVSRLLYLQGVSSDPAQPSIIEFDAFVRAGEGLFVYFSTLSQLNGDGWKNRETYEAPGVAVGEMSMEGPFYNTWPPQSHRVLFDDLPIVEWTAESEFLPPIQPPKNPRVKSPKQRKGDAAPPVYMVESRSPVHDARRLLTRFMTRACRGPVKPSHVDRYLQIIINELDRKACFQDAMRAGYTAALCSPSFLFYHESPGELTQAALAARLSYFFWKSVPDSQLQDAAQRDDLTTNDGLRSQVDRMLSDARSERMIEDLLGQWLDLDRIWFTQPDTTLYPEFDDFLRDSMIEETRATFRYLLEQNRPVRELVDSNEVMINARLAEHYGIDHVTGVPLQVVSVPPGSPRGGVLTQAAVLTVTANGTNTSPVTRGAWVLDRLLGTPPPKPPADVPAIEPDIEGATTIREQLAQHRDNDACRSCHAMIDPPGFALESFDVTGRWRDRYRSIGKGDPVKTTIKNKTPRFKLSMAVDATGQTADGRSFRDIDEFKQILLEQERQIARNVVERLVAYGTGSPVGFADRPEVEQILDQAHDRGYRLRDLFDGVVRSRMFTSK